LISRANDEHAINNHFLTQNAFQNALRRFFPSKFDSHDRIIFLFFKPILNRREIAKSLSL
jgi:hypothetical protein